MEMEPDQLRLILLLAGMLLVITIYLWDRYKRSRKRLKGLSMRQARRLQREFAKNPPPDPVAEELPGFSASKEDKVVVQEELFPDLDIPEEPHQEMQTPESDESADILFENLETTEAEAGAFSAQADDDSGYEDLSLRDDLPQLVLQIGLVAKRGEFRGEDIAVAMAQIDMKPGAMNIYHRYDSRFADKVLFSIANMVKPGHFPVKNMQGFSTPGILLFTQLPGIRDGMDIYSDMLYAANELAAILNGHLQDETHSSLTRQSIEHTKDIILEHRRQLRLAGVHR